MAAERDAFGFYFSAHPVDAARHLLAAHKVRTFAELADVRIAEGERVGATMAALVEAVRWRVSAKGRRYMMATPVATVRASSKRRSFDDEPCRDARSRGQGGRLRPARPSSSIAARATMRRGSRSSASSRSSDLAKRTRLQMTVRVPDGATGRAHRARAGRRARRQRAAALRRATGSQAERRRSSRAGTFALDGELAARIERITGEGSVDLSRSGAAEAGPGRLALRHPEAVAVHEAGDPVILLLVQSLA